MKKKRIEDKEILFITTALRMGGVQIFLLNYLPFLIQSGIKVSIAIQTTEKLELHSCFESMGCTIHCITPITKSKKEYMQDIKHILKSNRNICAVYDNQNYLNIFSLLVAARCGIKVRISHSHSSYETKSVKRKIQRALFRISLPLFATNYFACSQKSAKWLYGKKHKSKRCCILNNAVDEKRFAYNLQYRNEIRERLHLENNYIALHIGMFTDAKNHIFLLNLFAEYIKINPDARLILCGDGDLKGNIEAKIDELGIHDFVFLQGTVQDSEKYLSAADIFLFPSKYEGAPFSLIEAQASGINGILSRAIPTNIVFNDNMECCDLDTSLWVERIESLRSSNIDRQANCKNISNTGFALSQSGERFANMIKGLL